MSKTRDAHGKNDADAQLSPPSEFPPPLKPQRGLFVLMSLVLVATFAVILWLYFATVFHR